MSIRASDFLGTATLGASDVPTPRVVKISSFEIRDYPAKRQQDGIMPEDERKILLSFHNEARQLKLNVTNTQTLIALLGDEVDGWIGQSVELWCDPSINYNGFRGGLRVRPAPQPQPQQHPPPQPQPQPPPQPQPQQNPSPQARAVAQAIEADLRWPS